MKSIISFLLDPPEGAKPDCLYQEHLIEGFLYKYCQGCPNPRGKKKWLQQWDLNHSYQEELNNLDQLPNDLSNSIIVLKGHALIPRFYQDLGSRHTSDLDLLLPLNKWAQFEKEIIKLGYCPREKGDWQGNHHKWEFTKLIGEKELVIELHHKCFYQEENNFDWKTNLLDPFKHLKTLDDSHLLLHLIGHYANQHNFLKLFWLIDIYLLLKVGTFNWPLIWEKANQLKLKKGITSTLWFIHHHIDQHLGIWPPPGGDEKWNISPAPALIWQTGQRGVSYWLTKHMLKDGIIEAFQYDWYWLSSKLKWPWKK